MDILKKVIINTDGGARGNPGPAAIGVVIGEKKYGEYIGEATNNIAEYQAVILGLKKCRELLGKKPAKETSVEVRMDSELVVKQLNGEYRIKEVTLTPFFIQVWNLKQDFKNVEFIHVPREENKDADKIVNEILDKGVKKK